jgi:hypothetical protein
MKGLNLPFLPIRPRLAIALVVAAYACGWAHVNPAVLLARALHTVAAAIEVAQTMPTGS